MTAEPTVTGKGDAHGRTPDRPVLVPRRRVRALTDHQLPDLPAASAPVTEEDPGAKHLQHQPGGIRRPPRQGQLPRDRGAGLMGQITDVEKSLATTLFDTVRELQRHIAERAEEIAAPRIAAAERDRDDTVASLARSHAAQQQLLEDVIKELRRVIDARDTQLTQARRTMREHGINPLTGLKEA